MEIEEIIQNELRNIYNDDKLIFDKSRFAGGLTNYNYIMEIHGTEYVIRQPGGMTDVMIDRKTEKINNQIAYVLETKIQYQGKVGIMYQAVILFEKNPILFVASSYNDVENYLTKFKKTTETIKLK